MAKAETHAQPDRDADVDTILGHRHDNGADHWATPDGRIYVGNPFSTISCLGMLHELGVGAEHEAVAGGLQLLRHACREDGRIRVAPRAPLHPCYTAEAARMLCRFDGIDSEELQRTVDHLLEHAHEGGGWRCNFSKFGKGPETQHANPGATLYVLDVLRHDEALRHGVEVVDAAVGFLLDHWDTRAPLGPCHWGIGSAFLRVEYPFLRYNLFSYVYVLSFFERARADDRFLAALDVLESRCDEEGRLVVEHCHRGLRQLRFCAQGLPSERATERLAEVRDHLRP